MKELSLHILDIANNSVAAGASLVEITVDEDIENNRLSITVKDNGTGMSPEALSGVTDPFSTSRKTREVGLGVPLFANAARQSGGGIDISSQLGEGTVVTAWFMHNHIDRQPLGDIASTFVALVTESANIDFIYRHILYDKIFEADTREIKDKLKQVPINTPEVVLWLKDFIIEGINTLRR
ncbi:MAG: ATP-binding protein [Firmicutes bacterium]|nr:ATP-binding protein [Bacillota bacterium]